MLFQLGGTECVLVIFSVQAILLEQQKMGQLTMLQKKRIEELMELGTKKDQEILDLKAKLEKAKGNNFNHILHLFSACINLSYSNTFF